MDQLSHKALSLWAKKENDDGQELWLPLVAHLIDTKNVINWLYHHWLNESQMLMLQQNLSEEQTVHLIKFIGFFHDIGKATPAFQTKPSYNRDQNLDDELMEKLVRSGFDGLEEFEPAMRNASPHALAGEAILERLGLDESVGAIIGAHHGKPAEKNFNYDDQFESFTSSNYLQSDTNQEEQDNWQAARQEIIKYGLAKSGYVSLDEIPRITQQQAVLLTGLLIMADWVASSEYLNDDRSRPMFSLIPLNKGISDIDFQHRFQDAISIWNISDIWHAQPVTDINQQYEKRWGFKPRTVQQLMSRTIGNIIDPGMIIVEAPTGIGKSEIAMTAVEQLSSISGAGGLFMGLPTQATSNAMFNRVDQWVESLAKDDNSKLSIKLMHGKAQFNKKYYDLPHAENVGNESSVVINSWFSGKKSMLANFLIGTIDHLLLMSLKQKHLFLRHLGLSGKVVVIDELHAYDTYMNSYLKRALQWLGAYHIPVVALSATLPAEKRYECIESYYEGKFNRQYKDKDRLKNSAAYPLLTYMDGDEVKQFSDFPKAQNPQENTIIRFNGNDDELMNKVEESLSDGGIAGIIVNTVRRAQKLASMVPDNIPKLILHSAFLAPDRTKLENQLQSNIGKGATRPEKMIVIGTQVLEQSLDIDFDVLFTDIAPMDLLIQRMGRLHRHKIARPAKLAKPTTYILGINAFGDYGDANEAIYEKYYLMKTDYSLPNIIKVPDDVSKLVQKVYDTETDDEITDINEPRHDVDVFNQKEQQKASTYQIQRPYPRANIHGWLDRDKQGLETDTAAEAAVRDIKESIEVVLVQHTSDGDFLMDGTNLNDVNDDGKRIAQQLIRLPNAVTPNISKAIKELEEITSKFYGQWQNSIWLKGTLALPLDEHYNVHLSSSNYTIHYSQDLGLMYEKEGKDD